MNTARKGVVRQAGGRPKNRDGRVAGVNHDYVLSGAAGTDDLRSEEDPFVSDR